MTKMLNEVSIRLLNLAINDPTVKKALSFSSLKNGWHYGRGNEIKKNAVDNALLINGFLKIFGADVTEVFPHESGGVLISGYSNEETLDILCEPSGSFSLLHEDEEEIFCDIESLSIIDIQDYIKRIKWRQKKLSDSSIRYTIVFNSKDSKAPGFQSRTMEYQLLAPTVRENTAKLNVITSENSTPKTLPETPQFSYASNVV